MSNSLFEDWLAPPVRKALVSMLELSWGRTIGCIERMSVDIWSVLVLHTSLRFLVGCFFNYHFGGLCRRRKSRRSSPGINRDIRAGADKWHVGLGVTSDVLRIVPEIDGRVTLIDAPAQVGWSCATVLVIDIGKVGRAVVGSHAVVAGGLRLIVGSQ